jgi:hypothetical protein
MWLMHPLNLVYIMGSPSAEMNVTQGIYSVIGPRCMLKQVDGNRAGRCADVDSKTNQPGGPGHVFPCVYRWYQFIAFGDGRAAPKNSLFTTIPSHIVNQIRNIGHEQGQYMCFGVKGRGDDYEEKWAEDEDDDEAETKMERRLGEQSTNAKALSEWIHRPIITTKCSNKDAVIDWLFVPFIYEEESLNPEDERDNFDASDEIIQDSNDGETPSDSRETLAAEL